MPVKSVSQILSKELPILFTNKAITAFGGLAVFARFCKRLGLAELLANAVPDDRTSNNAIGAPEIVMSFLVGVLRGARRFAHIAWLRSDDALQRIFTFGRPPSASTVTRYFNGFRRIHVEGMWPVLIGFVLDRLPRQRWGYTLDLDSTIFVRYGEQQGSLKGYNFKKPGRASHHPLLAFVAELKIICHIWLRSGNTHTSTGAAAFLQEALGLLGEKHTVYAVRADSGFCGETFLAFLEGRKLPYVVAARFTNTVKRIAVSQVDQWTEIVPGIAVGEAIYQALGWRKARRLVVIRETVAERKKARGRKLIDAPGYTFHALVTSFDWPPEKVWEFYRARADCENRIKEFAEQYYAKCFCVENFFGTEAALRLIAFLFDLVALFKEKIMKDHKPMIERLRIEIFSVGASLGGKSGHTILRVGSKNKLRERFKRLLERINNFNPTASQLEGKT